MSRYLWAKLKKEGTGKERCIQTSLYMRFSFVILTIQFSSHGFEEQEVNLHKNTFILVLQTHITQQNLVSKLGGEGII
jgi:hypothetical protein